MNESSSPKPDQNSTESEKLLTLRFEYAWRYFSFHATQRTTMFNFFLVFSGFFVGACAKLLEQEKHGFLSIMFAFGAIITFIFIFVERRNEELVHVEEDVLMKLEEDLFKDYKFEPVEKRREFCGRLKKQGEGTIRVTILDRKVNKKSANCHGRWLPIIEFLLFIMYVLGALYSLNQSVHFIQ